MEGELSIPALRAPAPKRRHPLLRSWTAVCGLVFLAVITLGCVATLPWTMERVESAGGSPRYDIQERTARHLPPTWWGIDRNEGRAGDLDTEAARLEATARTRALERIARDRGGNLERLRAEHVEPTPDQVRAANPVYIMGTDLLGRDLLVRCMAGGGISLSIGLAAALLSVCVGTLYGAVAGYAGGWLDGVMMRVVDVLYGLPYVLLVVLLAVAADGLMSEYVSRERSRAGWVRSEVARQDVAGQAEIERYFHEHPDVRDRLESDASARFPARIVSETGRRAYELGVLLIAIGGVSWLTMARVVRGQVLSLKNQPFVEAARAIGVPVHGIFLRHLLPNLVGPIVVYATLTVPQAILQESFLSFLGIGVRPPMPSWGNLAADGLGELNPVRSHWWLLVFPCVLLGSTLLALNFVGEALREGMDPKSRER